MEIEIVQEMRLVAQLMLHIADMLSMGEVTPAQLRGIVYGGAVDCDDVLERLNTYSFRYYGYFIKRPPVSLEDELVINGRLALVIDKDEYAMCCVSVYKACKWIVTEYTDAQSEEPEFEYPEYQGTYDRGSECAEFEGGWCN